ncbi:hypothetical protein BDF22DRAFT_734854 [Syncephalis plumigaleata]|nr:hypothetical protein BDF22DRAFT_734854 [Syncephalis plumigaleata]
MPSATLPNTEDKAAIKKALPSKVNKILTATVARLYVAYPDPEVWTYTGLMGAIVLLRDQSRNNAFFFRLVDLMNGQGVLWEQELYNDFYYHQDKPFFHTFEIDNALAGFAFADEHEAGVFYKKVIGRESAKLARKRGGNDSGRGSGGFLFGSRSKKQRSKIDKSQISLPMDFRHLSHIGWDPDKGFDMTNVDPSWKLLIEDLGKYGISADALKDKDTAQFVYNYVTAHGGPQNKPATTSASNTGSAERRKPPPPPPSRKSKMPPPAPPARKLSPAPPAPSTTTTTATSSPAPAISSPIPPPPPLPPINNNAGIPPPPPLPPTATSNTSGGIPPPPPLPPTTTTTSSNGAGIPPPPPLPSNGNKASPLPASDSRNALLESIRSSNKSKLKSVTTRESTPLGAASAGANGQPTNSSSSPDGTSDTGGGLAASLANALIARQKVLSTNSDDEEEEEDDWSDDE